MPITVLKRRGCGVRLLKQPSRRQLHRPAHRAHTRVLIHFATRTFRLKKLVAVQRHQTDHTFATEAYTLEDKNTFFSKRKQILIFDSTNKGKNVCHFSSTLNIVKSIRSQGNTAITTLTFSCPLGITGDHSPIPHQHPTNNMSTTIRTDPVTPVDQNTGSQWVSLVCHPNCIYQSRCMYQLSLAQ